MTSQEIAHRTAVPADLAALGVKVVETDGVRVIEIGDAVREHFNVLLPVSELIQADPNWSPALRSCRLDPNKHAYHDSNSRQGELSLKKTGLQALADTANLSIVSLRRMPREGLKDTEIGWEATLAVRRSDGTERTIINNKVVDMDVEQDRLRHEIRNSKSYQNDQQRHAAFERRWLYEREHADAKAQTKAIERAIRLALQLPHSFTAAELQKPFLVFSVSFTPDYTDPETRRMLVEYGLGQRASQLYPASARPQLEKASAPVDPSISATENADGGVPPRSSTPPSAEHDGPEGFDGEEPGAGPPDEDGQTSFADPAGTAAPEAEAARAAGLHLIQFGRRYPGQTIEQIHADAKGPDYLAWLVNEMRATSQAAQEAQVAARAYLAVYAPDLLRQGGEAA